MTKKNKLEKLKYQLQSETTELENEIKEEFSAYKNKAQKKVRNVLIIAGTSALAIGLFRLLSPGKKKIQKINQVKESKYHKEESIVTARIKSAILAVLLEAAKNKLINYINEKLDDSTSD